MTAATDTAGAYQRALAHFKAGEYDTALELLQRLALRQPDDQHTLYGIAMCLTRLSRWDEAERLLAELAASHPDQQQYAAELSAVRARLRPPPPHAAPDLTRLGNEPGGGSSGTLAALLERDAAVEWGLSDFTGDHLLTRHRLLLSHRRLWLGVGAMVVLPLLGWVEGTVRDMSALLPDGLRGPAADAIGVLQGAAVLVLVTALGLVLSAVLSSRLTTYVVWAHRIDVTTGVVFRRHRTIWLFKLLDVQLTQDPVLLLAGSASLRLYVAESTPTTRRPPQVVGLGPASTRRRLQELLLFLGAPERRGMKKQFI